MKELLQPNDQRTNIIWTSYLACAYAEQFCEGENASSVEQIEAWSVIAKNKLYLGLQGFYGRTVKNLIETDLLDSEGNINWDNFDNELNLDEF